MRDAQCAALVPPMYVVSRASSAGRGVPWVGPPICLPRGASALSSTEQFTHACAECRKLITLQLEARERLEHALALSPGSPAVALLREKVGKLQADCEVQFLKAMSGLPTSR